jgi:ATP-dependent Clp protease protease subunit
MVGSESLNNIVETFYNSSVHIPSRRIIFGCNNDSESNELYHIDIHELNKSIIILNEISDEPIEVYINSSGGGFSTGLAAYDLIKTSQAKIETIALGECMSMSTIVLQAGSKRKAYPNTIFLIHEPSFEAKKVKWSLQEMRAELRVFEKDYAKLVNFYSNNLNLSIKEIKKIMSRGDFFDAEYALEIGLIDEIIKERN